MTWLPPPSLPLLAETWTDVLDSMTSGSYWAKLEGAQETGDATCQTMTKEQMVWKRTEKCFCYWNLLAHSTLVGRAHVLDCAKVKFCRCRRDFFISKWNKTLNSNLAHFFMKLKACKLRQDDVLFQPWKCLVCLWFFFFSDFILLGAHSGVGKMWKSQNY